VLNALRHQRNDRSRPQAGPRLTPIRAQRLTASEERSPKNRSSTGLIHAACSTPYGIRGTIAWNPRRNHFLMCDVLNALRHQRNDRIAKTTENTEAVSAQRLTASEERSRDELKV